MTRGNCAQKSLNRFIASKYLTLALFALILGVVLLVPAPARAEAVYAVLRDTDPNSFGGQVQSIWKQLLNVVNSFIIILMVMVAFAEILRLNISTYGIKKVLPTLILAIIAANFSYMFCRLIIDIANVSMSFLHCISGTPEGTSCVGPVQTTNIALLGKTAQLAPIGDFTWTNLASALDHVILDIILFIEAILLLCLAFLFIVRNWVLYFLVIFSPLAIISVVLPSTKKYFTQWWDALVKWTFMPLVSFIFIALANRLSGAMVGMQSGFQAKLIIPIFVGVCLYYAITLPFKLGGPIMQGFYKNTGAKFLAGKARETGVGYAQDKANFAWNRYKQWGLDAQRGQNLLGKIPGGKFIGKYWMGTALDKVNANKSETDLYAKGIVEGVQARHLERRGPKLTLQRGYNRNREGEIKEYGLYMTEDLIRKGLEDEKSGKTDTEAAKNLGILRNWRAGSAAAKIRMSTAEEAENSLLNKGTRIFMRDADDKTISAEERAQIIKSFGYSEEEYARFKGYYQFVTSDRDSTEAEAKKSIGDPTRDAMEEIVGTHNVAEFQLYSQRIAGLVNQFGDSFKTFCTKTDKEVEKMVDGMTEAERALWNKAESQTALKEGKKNLAFLRKIAIDQKALNRREVDKMLDTDTAGTEIRERMVEFADKNYQSKIVQIQKMVEKNGGQVPLHLADLASSDGKGGLKLMPLDGLRASRMRLLLDKRIQDGATEWMTQYGLSALGEALINGLPYESTDPGDILAVHYNRVQPGRSRKNARKGQQIELGVIKGMTLGNQTQALEAADHYYNFLRHYQANPDAIPEAIREDIIDDQKREREEIHARLKDEFSTDQLKGNLRDRGGAAGAELADIVERDSLTDTDHEKLYQLLQDTFKGASLQGTGGSSLGKMIIKSTFGERARVAEGAS